MASRKGIPPSSQDAVDDDTRAVVNFEPVFYPDFEAEKKKRKPWEPKPWGPPESTGKAASLLPTIQAPEVTNRGLHMLEDKSFIQDGVRYFPLSAAAKTAQAPRSTLLEWIKKGTKFNDRPLQSYHFAPANRYFLSEESIKRAANRFIRWPSQRPAGRVTLGETDDKTGYIGLTDAAQTIGVDHRTMWLWATQGKAPTDATLYVIKCPATDQFYIREKEISLLKELVPHAGLRRGRRPQDAPHP